MIADQIVQGDCISGMNGLPEGSVDLVFADPPFNIGYEYDTYNDRQRDEHYLDWSKQWMGAVHRLLKPTGAFWLAIGDEYAAELKVICTRELGFTCRSWVIWYYTFGVNCTLKFTRSHVHLFHFVKDPKSFTFNAEAVRVPSARQLVYGDLRAMPTGRVPDDTWLFPMPYRSEADLGTPQESPPVATPTDDSAESAMVCGAINAVARPGAALKDGFTLRPQDMPAAFPPDSSVWYFSRVAGTFGERRGWHGCQMPEQLLGRIIRACSNEGELVADPFGGSGTTLAVAKKLGRRYLGFELSEQYAANIQKRLDAIRAGDPLSGVENPLISAPPTAKGRKRIGPRVKTG
jgi:DNA modification methylase